MKPFILLLALVFVQLTPSMKKEQEHPKKETTPTQEAPKTTIEPTSRSPAPVSQQSPKPEAAETKDKSGGWPPWGDIFWPSWALVPRQEITIGPVVPDFVDDADIQGIKTTITGKGLYSWGVFTYEDIFGASHYTKFCHLYTWMQNDKTWGYYSDRHNEADY